MAVERRQLEADRETFDEQRETELANIRYNLTAVMIE